MDLEASSYPFTQLEFRTRELTNIAGIMISSALGTANTPRAHITNIAALDCLRDIGLWDEWKTFGHGGTYMKHFRWCETLAGEEYARSFACGAGPRSGDWHDVSPCHNLDLPQSLLEPLLVKYATLNGFKMRYDTQSTDFQENADLYEIPPRH